ncbi:MAG: hypothetical protein PVF94_15055, partial [Desulfobacterales bacterium]
IKFYLLIFFKKNTIPACQFFLQIVKEKNGLLIPCYHNAQRSPLHIVKNIDMAISHILHEAPFEWITKTFNKFGSPIVSW